MIQWIGVALLGIVGLVIVLALLLLFSYLKTSIQTRAVIDTISTYINIEPFINKTKDYVKKEKDL